MYQFLNLLKELVEMLTMKITTFVRDFGAG